MKLKPQSIFTFLFVYGLNKWHTTWSWASCFLLIPVFMLRWANHIHSVNRQTWEWSDIYFYNTIMIQLFIRLSITILFLLKRRYLITPMVTVLRRWGWHKIIWHKPWPNCNMKWKTPYKQMQNTLNTASLSLNKFKMRSSTEGHTQKTPMECTLNQWWEFSKYFLPNLK